MRKALILAALLLASCVPQAQVDRGERLFTAETFNGNGRTCSTCHRPSENFSISPATIQQLPASDPLFVAVEGLEDPAKLRADALIKISDDDEDQITEFRQTPKLTQIRKLCNSAGSCKVLGLRGDRETDLCTFSNEAIGNHLTRKVDGEPGVDFRLMTRNECSDIIAFMRSKRVSNPEKAKDLTIGK